MPKKFWSFVKNATTPSEGDLLLYGPISEDSWWGDEVTPKQFASDLKDLGDISTLNVRINSGGGDVFAATAIYNLLKAHKAVKNVYVDGLAASAATVIMMAGDTIKVPVNALIMIHNPSTGCWGNSADMQKSIDILNKVKDAIIATYVAKTGKDTKELSDLMDQEHWMTGKEAVDEGFADELLDSKPVAASLSSINKKTLILNGMAFDFSHFNKCDTILDKFKNSLKGDEPMTFEEIMAKMSDEDRKVIQDQIEAQKQSVKDDTTKELQASFDTEKQTLQDKITDLEKATKPAVNDEEQMLANLDPKVRAILDKANADAAAAQLALSKMQDAQELKQYTDVASSFKNLAVKADEFGPVFKNMAKNDKEGYDKVIALLKAADNCVDTAKLFGSNGKSTTDSGVSAWDQIQAKVKDAMVADPKLTRALAMKDVISKNPELYNQYKQEMENGDLE